MLVSEILYLVDNDVTPRYLLQSVLSPFL